jgi:hypothetical protein
MYKPSISPQKQKETKDEDKWTKNCKNEFLDTHTGLTGTTYRSDRFGQNRNSAVIKNRM